MTAHQVRSYGPTVNTNDPASQPPSPAGTAEQHPVPEYEIRVAGRLAPRWSAWFDGLTVTTDDDGTTVLHGPVVDQAALHGLLQKLRDVGIPLLSLSQIPITTRPKQPTTNPKEN
jgi:hypothetical protein